MFFRFSSQEIKELCISAFILAFTFGYYLGPIKKAPTLLSLVIFTLYFGIIVGIAFIVHESSHKFAAMRQGYWSEYRMWLEGLCAALLLALCLSNPYTHLDPPLTLDNNAELNKTSSVNATIPDNVLMEKQAAVVKQLSIVGFLFSYAAASSYNLTTFRTASWILLFASFTGWGIIFAAPGAAYYMPIKKTKKGFIQISMEESGKIAIAGPISNIVLASVFMFFYHMTSFFLFIHGALINLFLALFNLLPFGPLDGNKIYAWNKTVWFIAIIVNLSLFSLAGGI